tara:strand:- start:118 stop:372 length:255 start_codon:yes stop_codon:yes gene_type:complete
LHVGVYGFHRERNPRDEPPPPDGDDNSIDVGRVFQNLQTNAPRASDDVEVVKAVDVLHALLGDELLRRDGGVRDAVAFQDDIGA